MKGVEIEQKLFKSALVKNAEIVCGRTARGKKGCQICWQNGETIQAVKEKKVRHGESGGKRGHLKTGKNT